MKHKMIFTKIFLELFNLCYKKFVLFFLFCKFRIIIFSSRASSVVKCCFEYVIKSLIIFTSAFRSSLFSIALYKASRILKRTLCCSFILSTFTSCFILFHVSPVIQYSLAYINSPGQLCQIYKRLISGKFISLYDNFIQKMNFGMLLSFIILIENED